MHQYRPAGFERPTNRHLARLRKELHSVLREAQSHLTFDTLHLRVPELKVLAEMLIEFAEDLHHDLGIWAAYESYNREFFGVPLPFSRTDHPKGLHRDRVRHVLWVMYQELKTGLIIAPAHRDLEQMTDVAWTFLRAMAGEWPRESGLEAFLRSSNHYGWEVKRKLIWLGTQSYFFRVPFKRYLDENNRGRWEVGVVDDFLCQECTRWSGLGPIDILARGLEITEADRHDLRHWYERHASFYRVIAATADHLDTINIISDRPYHIRIDLLNSPFQVGHLVFGSLVPWRGEWYWSGEQELWRGDAISDIKSLRNTMKRKNSAILCRFWPEYEAQVRRRASEYHRQALARWGTDLVVYPDGLTMAAAWQRELQGTWDSRPQEEIKEVMRRHGLKKPRPEMKLPRDLLDHNGGIGVFLNPEEGKEILCNFTALVEGLKRRDGELRDQEKSAIEDLIEAETISPAFVRRVLTEHGNASVKAAYCLTWDVPDYWLDYLLRTRKGRFYRKRYPSFSVI